MATPRERAAIALAVAGREASDYARGIVGDVATPLRPGERIMCARRLGAYRVHVLDLTVILERADGATWGAIAEALHLPVHEVIARYAETYERWAADSRALDAWDETTAARVTDHDLTGTAHAVDAWWARTADPWGDAGARPATRALTT